MVLRMTKGAEEMRRGSIWIEKDRGVEERKGKGKGKGKEMMGDYYSKAEYPEKL